MFLFSSLFLKQSIIIMAHHLVFGQIKAVFVCWLFFRFVLFSLLLLLVLVCVDALKKAKIVSRTALCNQANYRVKKGLFETK